MIDVKYRYYYKSILLVFFILIPVFLFSCSDPQTAPNQQDKEIPTQLIAPTSALNQQSALKLSRQIKLLTKYSKFDSEIVTISDTNSMVPVFFSSEKLRMVIAGIKNKYTQGAKINKGSILAKPFSKTFEPALSVGTNHIKVPMPVIKTPIAI